MSLKAKIEAVIYASEEPVTLAQLTELLGQEGQAELDHLESQQQDLALEDGGEAEASSSPDAVADPDPDPGPDEDALNAEVMDTAEVGGQTTNAMDATEERKVRDGVVIPENAEDSIKTAEPVTGEQTPPVMDEKAVAAESAKQAKLKERRLREYFRELLDELMSDYANGDRGLEVREVAGGFRLATKPEYHDAVRGFVKNLKPPMKLTLQALETLAVVAYKQPVTAPEVSEIRGVDSAGVMGSLIARKLVTTAGRKQVIGRPILYKTTKDFLLRFGLKDINELPSIEEFEKMAGELNEAIQEEIPMENGEERDAGDVPDSTAADGHRKALDEMGAVPQPTHIHHDTAEDLMSDKSTSPEGNRREPVTGKDVEPERGTHSDQADGMPEEEPNESE